MPNSLPSIDLQIAKKLRDDPAYRRKFFLAETSANIARQLIVLRKRRGLSQKDVADLTKTGQPAISRVERADYHNWSFNTLRKLCESMDARLRVFIEPSEDVLVEYEREEAVNKSSARLADQNQPDDLLPEQSEPKATVPEVKPPPAFIAAQENKDALRRKRDGTKVD